MDILHKIGIRSSSPESVYKALTTREGLAAWWTTDVQGDGKIGGVLQFRFKLKEATGGFDMKVRELKPAGRVLWEVVDGPPEWIGTKISWDVAQEGGWTTVLFKHEGWREQVDFMHHCSTKWAVFLLSLRSYLETGKGAPNPHDVKLESWE
jgi:uncharacterized protein YndB with AHSA1/START domain